MAQLQLDIITPSQTVVRQKVDYVSATGVEGEFGILPGHVPLLAGLRTGPLHFQIGAETRYVFIGNGFLEVLDNRVTVLTEVAEMAKDIDVERAGKARERAERRLSRREAVAGQLDQARAQAALCRAMARLHVAGLNDSTK